MTSTHQMIEEITHRESVGSALLWFGVLGGPLAWSFELVVNYSLEEWFACSPATTTPGVILGIGVSTFALAITAVLTAVTVIAGFVSFRCYRRASSQDREASGRVRWMAVAGIMNSVLYLILILASFAPPAILGVCENSP